jgi:hypothetical protein
MPKKKRIGIATAYALALAGLACDHDEDFEDELCEESDESDCDPGTDPPPEPDTGEVPEDPADGPDHDDDDDDTGEDEPTPPTEPTHRHNSDEQSRVTSAPGTDDHAW